MHTTQSQNIRRAATAALSASTITLALLASAHPAQAWTYSLLHSFCKKHSCRGGGGPQATVNLDADGNLYGTTYYGGPTGNGVVYELSA